MVRAAVSVTWNVLSWSGGYEFEPWSCPVHLLHARIDREKTSMITISNISLLTLKVLHFWKLTYKWSGWISDSYCSLKPLCSGIGEVVPARTSPTLPPPSPRTVLSLSCFKVPSASIVATSTLRVNYHLSFLTNFTVLRDRPRKHRNRWAEPQCFFDDTVQVFELLDVIHSYSSVTVITWTAMCNVNCKCKCFWSRQPFIQ